MLLCVHGYGPSSFANWPCRGLATVYDTYTYVCLRLIDHYSFIRLARRGHQAEAACHAMSANVAIVLCPQQYNHVRRLHVSFFMYTAVQCQSEPSSRTAKNVSEARGSARSEYLRAISGGSYHKTFLQPPWYRSSVQVAHFGAERPHRNSVDLFHFSDTCVGAKQRVVPGRQTHVNIRR